MHGNSHQLPVTLSRVITFILSAYTGTGVSHSQHTHTHTHKQNKNSGEVLEKMQMGGPERLEISKGEIPSSKRSMYGYMLTYSWL